MMPQADWQTAKNQFDATWADSIPEKGKGFKPFQRWWHFADTRWAFEGAQERVGSFCRPQTLRIGLSAPPAVAFGSPLIPGSHTR